MSSSTDVTVTAEKIEIKGDKPGHRLYIRPDSHGSFVPVGYATKGSYLLSEGAEVKALKSAHQALQINRDLTQATANRIGCEVVEVLPTATLLVKIEATWEETKNRARSAEAQLRIRKEGDDKALRRICKIRMNEDMPLDELKISTSIMEELAILENVVIRLRQENKDLATRVKGVTTAHISDLSLHSKELQKEAACRQVAENRALTATSCLDRSQRVVNEQAKQIHKTRNLLRRTMEIGAELVQEFSSDGTTQLCAAPEPQESFALRDVALHPLIGDKDW